MKHTKEDKLFAIQQACRAELAKKGDYLAYLKLVHKGNYQIGKHNELIARKLEAVERGEIKRIAFFLPPRHSKSMTITETFPSYFIGRNPEKRVIEVSYSGDFAEAFGRRNREKIIQYGHIFRNEINPSASQAKSFELLNHRGGMISCGIDGQITGQGADLLLIDDPIKNRKEAYSKTMRERLWNEYTSSMMTRLQPNASIVLVMTRWHIDDLGGRMLASEDFEVIRLPAICNSENDPINRKIGDPLWPEYGFDLEYINQRKQIIGETLFNALYQNEPIFDGGSVIKQKFWKYYRKTELPPQGHWFQSWDMNVKKKADAKKNDPDYVVGLIGVKHGANIYLVDRYRKQAGFTESLKAIQIYQQKYPGCTTLIEDRANGSPILEVVRDKIPGVIPVNPTDSKEARVDAILTYIEAGNVFLPNEEWVDSFVTECSQFPNGAHDDQVDTLSQMLNYVYHSSSPGIIMIDL